MSNDQQAVRLYWRVDMGLIWVPTDDGREETASPGQCARIVCQIQEQRDSLAARLAEAEGREKRLREALVGLSVRPRGHHNCGDYERGYGQRQAEVANLALAALSTEEKP